MRTIPFREVLYDIARKNSIDPESDNFLEKEAIAMGTFIDQWVRRTYPGADWPEWTQIYQFFPSNHIVSWDAIAVDLVIPPSTSGTLVRIGRVFTVYLVDPRTTSFPVSTNHTLLDTGIHCGYEHGGSVWIKFMQPAPHFSAERWRPDETYKKDDVRYSSTTGECYRSKASGNLGHDPATTFSPPPPQVQPSIQLRTEETSTSVIGNPGIPETNQDLGVFFAVDVDNHPVPNPPPNNSRFFVEVVDSAGGLLGDATAMGDGIITLDSIVTDLANQLISQPALSGFTITVDSVFFILNLSSPSNFRVNQAFWGPFAQPNRNVLVQQWHAFIPLVPPVQHVQQTMTAWITDEQVIPEAVYTLTFFDIAGEAHVVNYTASVSDNADQILAGLITGIQSAAPNDPFFAGVISSIDTVSNSASFSTSTKISLNADMMLPGSPWWELVLMPIDLADQIMRGTTADVLKEWGQVQAGGAEEQLVPAESQASTGKFSTNQTPQLTGQQNTGSRYKV